MFQRTLVGPIVILVASSVLSQAAAQPAPVEVSLVSVTPGTESGDGDWCIGAGNITLNVEVIDLSTLSPVTEGRVEYQFCALPTLGGVPKEDCEANGSPRFVTNVFDELEQDPTPDFTFTPPLPVMGLRLRFIPNPGGQFKRAISVPFNLDRTC